VVLTGGSVNPGTRAGTGDGDAVKPGSSSLVGSGVGVGVAILQAALSVPRAPPPQPSGDSSVVSSRAAVGPPTGRVHQDNRPSPVRTE